MPPTLALALADAVARLRASHDPARAEASRSDAEELLSRLLGIGRGDLRLAFGQTLDAAQAATLERWLARRMAGEPVQYVTGRAAFRDLDLAVTPAVLIPRPETEGLVEAVLEVLAAEHMRWTHPRVLDLGTGSGAIALALASEHPDARVTATDASDAALAVALLNAEALGLTARVRFADGDWFDAVPPDERFEVVVSNPPYVGEQERDRLPADVRDHEPAMALFADEEGLADVRAILDAAPRQLVARGLLALELSESHAEHVATSLEGAHDWEHVELRRDLSGRPRVLLARRAAGPAIAPAQWEEEG
jgi:release factor glutamine methyltransferase